MTREPDHDILIRIDERQKTTLDKVDGLRVHVKTQNGRIGKLEDRADNGESRWDRVFGGCKLAGWIVGAIGLIATIWKVLF